MKKHLPVGNTEIPNFLGNAHLVAGSADCLRDILTMLADGGIKTEANPDLYTRVYAHFGIDEARELIFRASLRPFGDRRVFVIVAPDLTREAQNALLKTLEEPPANALFIFLLPSPQTLLPTLRSRAQMLELEDSRSQNVDTSAFIMAPTPKRLDMLKSLLEKGEDDKRDLGAILAFLASLEQTLSKDPQKNGEGLQAIYRARKYVTDKGALVKPLLEQVALLLPRLS